MKYWYFPMFNKEYLTVVDVCGEILTFSMLKIEHLAMAVLWGEILLFSYVEHRISSYGCSLRWNIDIFLCWTEIWVCPILKNWGTINIIFQSTIHFPTPHTHPSKHTPHTHTLLHTHRIHTPLYTQRSPTLIFNEKLRQYQRAKFFKAFECR